MAVPVPRTYVASEFETATILNGDIRDTFNFQLQPPRAFAYRSAALSIANSGTVLVNLDAELYDPYSPAAHDNATNNSRLVAAETGLYFITASASFTNASDATRRLIAIRKNAAGNPASGTQLASNQLAAINGFSTTVGVTVEAQLNATDYVEMFLAQGSTTNPLALNVGADQTFMQIRWVTKL